MAMVQDGAFSIVAGLFMISVLVLVHEAGHFVAAKIFGVDVPVFSIGMGPRLFGFKWRGTDYRVSALLIGGYVQMAGADPFGEEDTSQLEVPSDRDFMKKPVWQRLIIMAAGPGVNLALPFVLFTILLMLGRPDWDRELGDVLPGTPAAELGLQPGDRVLSVDGQKVDVWKEVEDALEARVGTLGDVALHVDRAGRTFDVALPASALRNDPTGSRLDLVGVGLVTDGTVPFFVSSRVGLDAQDTPAGRAGLKTGDHILEVDGQKVETWDATLAALGGAGTHTVRYERWPDDATVDTKPTEGTATLSLDGGAWTDTTTWANPWGIAPITLFANRVEPETPAARAGVLPGDRFLRVDGTEVLTFHHFIDLVSRTAVESGTPRALELVVLRDGKEVALSITPELRVVTGEAHQRPILGVGSFGGMGTGIEVVRKYHTFAEAVPRAVEESVTVIESTASILGNILTWKAKPSENLGGPIAIFYMADRVAREGFFPYAAVIGMISVSLGVINLLPVPVFDGGQILFYTLEAIRGRPLSLELRERFQMIGVVSLMILMLLVTANDIKRVAGL